MHSLRVVLLMSVLPAVLALPGTVQAQSKGLPSGGIVCWKDKAGKTIGCGDKVPPEYQDNASNQLNQRGVTINQTDAALTPEQKKAIQAEGERKKVEDARKAEQKRADTALMDTFTSVSEIDLKLNREVQLIEASIETLQSNLKNNSERMIDAKARAEKYTKEKRPVPPVIEEEITRVANERTKTEGQIMQKRKDIDGLKVKYDGYKQRFIEVKGAAAGESAKPAPQPVAGTAPAKK